MCASVEAKVAEDSRFVKVEVVHRSLARHLRPLNWRQLLRER